MNQLTTKSTLLLAVMAAILGTGCIGKRAIGLVAPVPGDPNERLTVSNAYFERKINAVGAGTILLSTAASAYVGSNSNIISSYRKDGSVSTNKLLNGAVGAGAGFGLSYSISYMAKGKEKDLHKRPKNKEESMDWVRKKIGKGYAVIADEYGFGFENFRVIPKAKAANFRFSDRMDFTDYEKAFYGNLTYRTDFEKNLLNSLTNLSRANLVWLYQSLNFSLTPTTKERVEEGIFDKSYSIEDLTETASVVPRLREKAGTKAYGMSKSISDYGKVARGFPEYAAKSKEKAISLVKEFYTVREFKSSFPLHQKELLLKAEQLLSGADLYKLGELFEVSCLTIYPSESRLFFSYMPPDAYSVTTIKGIEPNNIRMACSSVNAYSSQTESLTSIDAGFLKYSLKVAQPSLFGKVLQYEVKNLNSSSSLTYCLHNVNDNIDERIKAAALEEAIDEGFDEIKRNIPDDWKFVKFFVKGIELIYDGYKIVNNPKNAILGAAADALIKEDPSMGVKIGKNVLIGYLSDFARNIP
ncbi:MAG: hypothetical protein IPN76_10440 [Saprospiraceae bacterium]|nr:hypothetical protein [Saprospiraceae bacterium]